MSDPAPSDPDPRDAGPRRERRIAIRSTRPSKTARRGIAIAVVLLLTVLAGAMGWILGRSASVARTTAAEEAAARENHAEMVGLVNEALVEYWELDDGELRWQR